jgi:heme/copper-type cytochrome/quinol oxidase subunit 2
VEGRGRRPDRRRGGQRLLAPGGLERRRLRWLQSGYLYHYALAMILGIFVLMTYFVWLANKQERDKNMGWLSLAIWTPIVLAPCCCSERTARRRWCAGSR